MANEIAEIDNLVTSEDSYEEIKRVGILYQKKTVESILAFARVVFTLKQKCDKDEDKDFSQAANEFFGLSQSGASQFAKTGQNAEKLVAYAQSLPPSSRTLYELTQLSLTDLDKHINTGDINPNSTVNDIKAIKDTIKDTKKAKKGKSDDVNPFNVEAEDEDGNPIDAELVDDETGGEENTKAPKKSKDNKKMSIVEALAIFDIDMNMLYMEHLQKGKDKEVLDKAFFIITGEKL